ncbi:MAG: hypothetical protein ACREEW_01370 [Caulobacteraceae bacterium]
MSDAGLLIAAPDFDAARLIADVRKGDPAALAQAYKITFGHDLGRLVLAHHMAECGVGNALGGAQSAGALRYQAGRHDAALALASAAGFDQASIAVAVLSDTLQGTQDDDAFNHPSDPSAYVLPDDEPL